MAGQVTSVSSKGQTVVPAPIRKKLGIREGTALDWRVQDGKIIVTVLNTSTVNTPFETFNEWSSQADEDAYDNL